jgi:hypothetical protein
VRCFVFSARILIILITIGLDLRLSRLTELKLFMWFPDKPLICINHEMRAGNPAERQNIMGKTFKHEDIEQILAEADALLKQTDPEVIEYMEEERRLQLEQHAQSLKKLKSEVHDKIEKEGSPESRSYGEGMHEAIEDIVKAMKTMASYLS